MVSSISDLKGGRILTKTWTASMSFLGLRGESSRMEKPKPKEMELEFLRLSLSAGD